MPNKNINKVIYGGRVLIDLTGDTVDPSKLLKGSKAHDKSGAQIEGACTFDVDSTDATAVAAEILFPINYGRSDVLPVCGKDLCKTGKLLTSSIRKNCFHVKHVIRKLLNKLLSFRVGSNNCAAIVRKRLHSTSKFIPVRLGKHETTG